MNDAYDLADLADLHQRQQDCYEALTKALSIARSDLMGPDSATRHPARRK